MSEKGFKILKRPSLGGAVYVLPNLLTTGNLFFGFYSLVQSLSGHYESAATAIMIAGIFDVLDGRVARMTGGTSEFGVQYDSLCDLLSFGVAPAFLSFKYGLDGLGRLGWVLCFLFLACGALRLARFNVQSSIGKAAGDFTGLPIPMAAIVIALFVAAVEDLSAGTKATYQFISHFIDPFTPSLAFRQYFLVVAVPSLALAMVSNLAYRSHKKLKFSVVKPFRLLVLFVLATSLIATLPELFGFLLAAFYALSGPLEWALGWKKPIDEDEIFTPILDSSFEPEGSVDD